MKRTYKDEFFEEFEALLRESGDARTPSRRRIDRRGRKVDALVLPTRGKGDLAIDLERARRASERGAREDARAFLGKVLAFEELLHAERKAS